MIHSRRDHHILALHSVAFAVSATNTISGKLERFINFYVMFSTITLFLSTVSTIDFCAIVNLSPAVIAIHHVWNPNVTCESVKACKYNTHAHSNLFTNHEWEHCTLLGTRVLWYSNGCCYTMARTMWSDSRRYPVCKPMDPTKTVVFKSWPIDLMFLLHSVSD